MLWNKFLFGVLMAMEAMSRIIVARDTVVGPPGPLCVCHHVTLLYFDVDDRSPDADPWTSICRTKPGTSAVVNILSHEFRRIVGLSSAIPMVSYTSRCFDEPSTTKDSIPDADLSSALFCP